MRAKPVTTPDDKVTSPFIAGSSKEEDSNRLEQHNLITGDAFKRRTSDENDSVSPIRQPNIVGAINIYKAEMMRIIHHSLLLAELA